MSKPPFFTFVWLSVAVALPHTPHLSLECERDLDLLPAKDLRTQDVQKQKQTQSKVQKLRLPPSPSPNTLRHTLASVPVGTRDGRKGWGCYFKEIASKLSFSHLFRNYTVFQKKHVTTFLMIS